jgi:SUN domain-containing protein 1/2
LEQSDEEVTDGGKRRRRKVKKNMLGPLTTLPVIDQEKRRRRRSRTKADGVGEGEEEEVDEGDEEEEDSGSDSPQVRSLPNAPLKLYADILTRSSVLSIHLGDTLRLGNSNLRL